MNVIKMVDKDGFIDEFWRVMKEARQTEPDVKKHEIYERMESAFFSTFGCNRFPSYDAFRKYMERKYNDNQ